MKIINRFLRGKNKIVIGTLFLWLIILFIFSVLIPIIPFNADEARNYLDYSRFGPIYPIFNYGSPNNHVFFTVLQSLLVPKVMLSFLPAFPRLLNIITGTGLFLFLFIFIKRESKGSMIFWFILTAACLLVSPLVTPYFIVARGYLLGLMFLILGIYFLTEKKFYLSSILFILSGFTIPTYAYALPLIYLTAICVYKDFIKKALLAAVFAFFGLFICYLPSIGLMLYVRNIWGYTSLSQFIIQTILTITNFSYINFENLFNIIYLVVFIIGIVIFLKEKENKKIKNFIVFLISAIISYLLVICLLSVAFHANQPYLRNGLFIPLFIVIIMVIIALLTKNNSLRIVIFTIIVLNTMSGAYLFASNFFQSKPNYPVFVGEQYYGDNALLQLIKNKNIKNIPKSFRNNELANYYLFIYSPNSLALLNKVNDNHAISSRSTETSKLDFNNKAILAIDPKSSCKKEVNPVILPTSKLYIFKKTFQMFTLKIIDFFDYSKKYSMRYLLRLSDNTYAEADYLWKNQSYDVAISTASRAENYMTMLASDMKILSIRQQKDSPLYLEINSSVCLHQKILQTMTRSKYGSANKLLLDIIYFSRANFKTAQLIKE